MEGSCFDEGNGEVDRGHLSFRDVDLVLVEFGSKEETVAFDASDGGMIPSRDGFTDLGFSFFDVLGEVFRDDRLHDREGGGAGESVAAVGRAVTAGAEERCVLLRNPKASNGEPAAHSFGPGDSVGLDVGSNGFPAVDFAGPPEAGLDFIQEKEKVVLFGEGCKTFEKFLGGDIHSSFALDGLDEEGCRFVGDGIFGGNEVIKVGVNEAREERAEALVNFSLCGGRHCSDGPSVEAFAEGDDFVPVAFGSESPCKFDQPVVGFRAGVGKEDLSGLADNAFDKKFGEVCLFVSGIEIRAVHERLRLIGDRFGKSWMAVADRAGGDAGTEVEILTSAVVPHLGSATPHDGQGKPSICLEKVMLCFF